MSGHSVFVPEALCSTRLPLDRVLVRQGFVFKNDGDSLDFGGEAPHNRTFLDQMLMAVHVDPLRANRLAYPVDHEIDQEQWLRAWQRSTGGSEGGGSGLMNMELAGLDAYISGIARWLSALGIVTQGSCDGHGKTLPRLHFKNPIHIAAAKEQIKQHSQGKISFDGLVLCGGVRKPTEQLYADMLDLAEALYQACAPNL